MTVLPFRPRRKPTLKQAVARLGGCCIVTTFALSHGSAEEQQAMKEQIFDRALAVVMMLLDDMPPAPMDVEEAQP